MGPDALDRNAASVLCDFNAAFQQHEKPPEMRYSPRLLRNPSSDLVRKCRYSPFPAWLRFSRATRLPSATLSRYSRARLFMPTES